MSRQEILNCSFPLWYKHLHAESIESVVLKIPQIFIDYLLADGLFLPDNPVDETPDVISTDEENQSKRIFLDNDFVEFQSQVVSAISELGGKVFPKLNWSSPRDASWIAVNGSLCCENFNDICLLLKSSEFITHDLTDPFMMSQRVNVDSTEGSAVEYVLVLRKWIEICPSGEYRCFIKNNKLIAISQRSDQYFSFIEGEKNSIVRSIKHFHKNFVHEKFPNTSYILDLYAPGSNRRPIIIDFNPFVRITDGLLFSWDELEEEVAMPELVEGNAIRGVVFRSLKTQGTYSSL